MPSSVMTIVMSSGGVTSYTRLRMLKLWTFFHAACMSTLFSDSADPIKSRGSPKCAAKRTVSLGHCYKKNFLAILGNDEWQLSLNLQLSTQFKNVYRDYFLSVEERLYGYSRHFHGWFQTTRGRENGHYQFFNNISPSIWLWAYLAPVLNFRAKWMQTNKDTPIPGTNSSNKVAQGHQTLRQK